MSEVSKFLDRIPYLDESVKNKISTTTKLEDLVSIASDFGYCFTAEELCTEIQKLTNDKKAETDFINTINLPSHLSEGVAGLDALSSEILMLCSQNSSFKL